MCFSATASFVGGGLLAGAGVATLTQVEHRRELVLASLPLAFGVHQVLEGLVWLGVQGQAPLGLGDEAVSAYMFYAQALLPLLGPLAVLLVARPDRRRWMVPFVVLGAGLAAYIAWTLVTSPITVEVRDSSLDYRNPGLSSLVAAGLYVILTVGPFLLSGRRYLIAFGALNLVGLSIVLSIKAYAFTSLWCAYAAAASVVLFLALRRRRKEPATVT